MFNSCSGYLSDLAMVCVTPCGSGTHRELTLLCNQAQYKDVGVAWGIIRESRVL